MKRLILALIPLMMIAQLPFRQMSFVPAEWIKSIEYGLKWTELMLNKYPGQVAAETPKAFASAEVTLVRLAKAENAAVLVAHSLPDPENIQIEIEKDLCAIQAHQQMEKAIEAIRLKHQLQFIKLQTRSTVRL